MATVRFKLNNPKPEKKTSILVEFYINRTIRPVFATGEKVKPEYWDGTRVTPATKGHPTKGEASNINRQLAKIEADLMEVWRDNKAADRDTIVSKARVVVSGEDTVQKKTVVEALTRFIAQYAREKEIGTVKRYRGLLKKLTAFNPELTFEELDHNFYSAFKNFLYDTPNPLYTGSHLHWDIHNCLFTIVPGVDNAKRVGLFDEVVFKYFINIKTLCAWAEKRDYPVHKSYKEWEIIKRDYSPISLTQDELERIETVNLPEKHLDVARDYLSLECRTGQRISDLKRFSKNDIEGTKWIFTQKKGNRIGAKQITLPLIGFCAPALVILQKYNYELPKISEQKLNKHIKTVCEKAGLTYPIYIERWAGNKKIRIPGAKSEFISSHTGRKTFITLALQKGIPAKVVMDLTGIRSYKTLRHYDGQSEIGTVEKWLTQIEDKSVMRKAN